MFPALPGEFSTTEPPGKPVLYFLTRVLNEQVFDFLLCFYS